MYQKPLVRSTFSEKFYGHWSLSKRNMDSDCKTHEGLWSIVVYYGAALLTLLVSFGEQPIYFNSFHFLSGHPFKHGLKASRHINPNNGTFFSLSNQELETEYSSLRHSCLHHRHLRFLSYLQCLNLLEIWTFYQH
jgi:hypothetical protein